MANFTTTTSAVFIPEVWKLEVIANYLPNRVMPMLVRSVDRGPLGKGDTIHIPRPGRSSAVAKAQGTGLTYTTDTAAELVLTIDQHYAVPHLFEDFVEALALPSLRQFYTQDAGEGIATQINSYLIGLGALFGGGSTTAGTAYSTAVIGGDGVTAWDGSANTNTGNGTAITDLGFRGAHQKLDDADVPMNRSFVAPPVTINSLRGIDRYNSSDFINGRPVVKGEIGMIYETRIISSTTAATVLADDSSTAYRAGLLFHRDAMAFIDVKSVRVQTQYELDELGTKVVADAIWGGGIYRPENGIAIIVPS